MTSITITNEYEYDYNVFGKEVETRVLSESLKRLIVGGKYLVYIDYLKNQGCFTESESKTLTIDAVLEKVCSTNQDVTIYTFRVGPNNRFNITTDFKTNSHIMYMVFIDDSGVYGFESLKLRNISNLVIVHSL